jgi:hypothetical protein
MVDNFVQTPTAGDLLSPSQPQNVDAPISNGVNVIKPDGTTVSIPKDQLASAQSAGYKLETQDQKDIREAGEKSSAITVGARSFINQALLGIPGIISDHSSTDKEKAIREAEDNAHPYANYGAGALGFGASLIAGSPLFKGAAEAGKAVEAGIAGESLASKVLATGARYATEGAAVAAPKAFTEAALGDPEQAGESLLYGAGGGIVLGGLAAGTGVLARSMAQAGKDYLETGAGKLAGMTADEAREAIGSKVGKVIGGAIGTGAGAVVGHGAGAVIGDRLGEGLGEHIGDAIGNSLSDETVNKGLEIASKAMQYTADKLDTIPEILDSMASKGFSGASPGGNVFANFSKQYEGKTDKEAYSDFLNDLGNASTNLNTLSKNTGTSSDLISHGGAPEIGSQYNSKQLNMVNYLMQEAPRNPDPPKPFTKDGDSWQPSDKDLSTFKQKMETVNDPFSVLDRLKDGTLTKSNVDALKAVYPKLYAQISNQILSQSFNKELPFQARSKISLLTGMSIDNSFQHNKLSNLQAMYAENDPSSQGGNFKANISAPGAQPTQTNKLSA